MRVALDLREDWFTVKKITGQLVQRATKKWWILPTLSHACSYFLIPKHSSVSIVLLRFTLKTILLLI